MEMVNVLSPIYKREWFADVSVSEPRAPSEGNPCWRQREQETIGRCR